MAHDTEKQQQPLPWAAWHALAPLRDGRPAEVPARELVPGDIVVLAAGARVPADLRLLESTALRIDESSLTGESAPAAKDAEARVPPSAELAERPTMAYAGTLVTARKGRGAVVGTAMSMEGAGPGRQAAGQAQRHRAQAAGCLRISNPRPRVRSSGSQHSSWLQRSP